VNAGVFAGDLDTLTELLSERLDQGAPARRIAVASAAQILRTDDGQLIYVTCDGLFDISPEIRERIRAGGEVDPSEYYFRTAVTFETGAEKYRWLNRLLAVGIGRRTPAGMVTEVFAIK
jgi:hypothetical protein